MLNSFFLLAYFRFRRLGCALTVLHDVATEFSLRRCVGSFNAVEVF